MYKGLKVIDVHGHLSSPPEFTNIAAGLVNVRKHSPKRANYSISDERLEGSSQSHLKIMDDRQVDVQMISPRPVNMWHWEVPPVQEVWCKVTNDTIAQACKLHPDRFLGIGQLPQNVNRNSKNCLEELERCIKELGFIGVVVNPDPGADGQAPGMDDEDYWYPLYEKAQRLNAVIMVHGSGSKDSRMWNIPESYQVNNYISQFLATLQLENSRAFEDFPNLHIYVSHMGCGLNRFLPEDDSHYFGNKPIANLQFDTCVHDDYYMMAGFRQKGVDRLMFGTEAPGAGSGATRLSNGKPADDLLPVIDGFSFLSDEDKLNIFHHNAQKFFPIMKVE